MKPVIIYVDDEPRNLTVFEASVPEDWQVTCFDSAVEALKRVKELNPWLVISDQKMPQMTGLEFLEVVSQIAPEAVRIVVTGQTEEQTIIQLVRRAKIFDYITKPWETDILISQLQKAIDYFKVVDERKRAVEELRVKAAELEKANVREVELRTEIGAWAPAPIVWAIKEKKLQFPARRNLVAITYDIVDSSALHGMTIQNKSVHSHVQKIFMECLVKMGGLKESMAGDSIYAHFGAVDYPHNPHTAAMMVAQEFRVGLRTFSKLHGVKVECGIAVHYAPETLLDMHEVRAQSNEGLTVQKWIESSSPNVDLLHRMEKIVHKLPGSNVIMSSEFFSRLPDPPARIQSIVGVVLKGQGSPVDLCMLLSDQVTPEAFEEFKKELKENDSFASEQNIKIAA